MKEVVRAAAVQAEPVWFDAQATTDKTISMIEEAAAAGAEIIAFPETWIPGYPTFLMYTSIDEEMPFVAEYRRSSIAFDGPELKAIRDAAARNGVFVGIGFAERSNRSLYMSQALISDSGSLQIARRKLKPTHRERALYGQGDGSDLQVADTSLGRVGALLCWEHLQPLNKMAMLSAGEQIHISGWPLLDFFGGNTMSNETIAAANCSYALECGTFVLMSTQVLSREGRSAFNRYGVELPEFTGGGGARIYGPDGSLMTETLPTDVEGIVYADLNLGIIELTNYLTDPAGHYSRPDIYTFEIDRTKRRAFELRGSVESIAFEDVEEAFDFEEGATQPAGTH